MKEALYTLFFLRPAVDAYRVSTSHEDEDATIDPLSEIILNKCIELATESIPGAVLQLYVWLQNPEQAGTYALVSIAVSAATTGYTSAMMAFDIDVDVPRHKNQPIFYGYIPDDNTLRGRCFILMTLISMLHNMSRSLGSVLLLAAGGMTLFVIFSGGELALFVLFKIATRDFYYWPRMEGFTAVVGSLFSRIIVKTIVDFSGCLHVSSH